MEFMPWLGVVFSKSYTFLQTNSIGGYTIFDVLISLMLVSVVMSKVVKGGGK